MYKLNIIRINNLTSRSHLNHTKTTTTIKKPGTQFCKDIFSHQNPFRAVVLSINLSREGRNIKYYCGGMKTILRILYRMNRTWILSIDLRTSTPDGNEENFSFCMMKSQANVAGVLMQIFIHSWNPSTYERLILNFLLSWTS